MISELKDDDILDFLMTSDLEGDYKPEELRYLLFKLRYFYKDIFLRHKNLKDDSEFQIKKLLEEISFSKTKIDELSSIIISKDLKIDGLKNKKLTFKERLTGKITNKDEN